MINNDTIIRQANRLIRKYETRDPFRIAAQLGVNVMFTDKLHRLKGMYRVIKRSRFIILNKNNSEQWNRIVCAHELGHDLLHRNYAAGSTLRELSLFDLSNQQEYEANIFAACLLLEDSEVLGLIEQGFNAEQIASATGSDINLVALKVDCLRGEGYDFRKQDHNAKFLK